MNSILSDDRGRANDRGDDLDCLLLYNFVFLYHIPSTTAWMITRSAVEDKLFTFQLPNHVSVNLNVINFSQLMNNNGSRR